MIAFSLIPFLAGQLVRIGSVDLFAAWMGRRGIPDVHVGNSMTFRLGSGSCSHAF